MCLSISGFLQILAQTSHSVQHSQWNELEQNKTERGLSSTQNWIESINSYFFADSRRCFGKKLLWRRACILIHFSLSYGHACKERSLWWLLARRSTGILSSISVFLSRLEKFPEYLSYRVSLFFIRSEKKDQFFITQQLTKQNYQRPLEPAIMIANTEQTNRGVVRQYAMPLTKKRLLGSRIHGFMDSITEVFSYKVNTPVEIIAVYTRWAYHAD